MNAISRKVARVYWGEPWEKWRAAQPGFWNHLPGSGNSKCKGLEEEDAWPVWGSARRPVWPEQNGCWETSSEGTRRGRAVRTGQQGKLCKSRLSSSCVDNRVQGGHQPSLGQRAQLRGNCENPMVDESSHYLQQRAGKVHVLEWEVFIVLRCIFKKSSCFLHQKIKRQREFSKRGLRKLNDLKILSGCKISSIQLSKPMLTCPFFFFFFRSFILSVSMEKKRANNQGSHVLSTQSARHCPKCTTRGTPHWSHTTTWGSRCHQRRLPEEEAVRLGR